MGPRGGFVKELIETLEEGSRFTGMNP